MKVGMRPVAEQYKTPLNRREIPRKPSQHRPSDAGLDQELKMPHLKVPFHHTDNTNITTTRQCWVPQIGDNLHRHSQLWNYYCFTVSWYLKAIRHKMLYTMFVWSNALNLIQGDSFGTRPKKMRTSQRLFIRFWINFCNTFTYKYI
jgi:hypothetical protein